MRASVVHDPAPVPEDRPEPAAGQGPLSSPLSSTRRLLVVCAHPFDATLALGGVIAAFADAGTAVQIVCLTHDPGPDPDACRREVAAAELLRAAALLGAREATLLEHRTAQLQWNPPEVLAAELRFRLRYRNHWGIEVRCTDERVSFGVPRSKQPPVTVAIDGEQRVLGPGERWEARRAGRR